MNSRIQKRMFTIPVTIHVMSPPDSSGDREEARTFVVPGYVVDHVVTFETEYGTKVVSKHQIYVSGESVQMIPDDALISCLTHSKVPMLKKDAYRKARNVIALGVLMIP